MEGEVASYHLTVKVKRKMMTCHGLTGKTGGEVMLRLMKGAAVRVRVLICLISTICHRIERRH